MALRGVTFDLWETLIVDRRDNGSIRFQRRIQGTIEALARAGVPVTPEDVAQAYRTLLPELDQLRRQGRDISSEEQVRRFLDAIRPGVQERIPGEALAAIRHRYTTLDVDARPQAIPGAREALQAARQLGLRIGLISNTAVTPGRVLRDVMAAEGLLEFFDTLTFSDEVELAKPAPRIFRDTLDALGVAPEDAAHVGDHARWDILGAQGVGMRTIQLRHPREDDSGAVADVLVDSMYDVIPVLERWVAGARA